MRSETAPTYSPKDGLATLVLARHTTYGAAINFVAVDQNKKFVASVRGKAHAIASLPPGEYTFYLIAETTDPIRATIEAGRTYVIETRVRPGFWKAQATAEAVRRNTPRFAEAAAWIKESKPLVPDGNGGQQWVDAHADNIAQRISKVDAVWSSKDAEWQAQHTLATDDGFLADELKL
ncbi:MAG TPA: hypothetical protein VFX59_19340 [Polyangiales bacterium]|nr:hypothetical protein [Polyangiales bacterium]